MSKPEAERVFNALWWQEIVWIALDNTHVQTTRNSFVKFPLFMLADK